MVGFQKIYKFFKFRRNFKNNGCLILNKIKNIHYLDQSYKPSNVIKLILMKSINLLLFILIILFKVDNYRNIFLFMMQSGLDILQPLILKYFIE